MAAELLHRWKGTPLQDLYVSINVDPSDFYYFDVPEHLKDIYYEETNDLTPEVIRNVEFLQLNYLVVIGGDDTLKYAVRLHNEGVKIIGIPKTMDGDVYGTDYCIGFSTCITRTISLIHTLSASAGSHERFLVIEVFGRYAGFTAMMPTLAGMADRCVIPEVEFKISQLAELMVMDRANNPGKFSTVVVSEGARFKGMDEMPYTHSGIGDIVAQKLRKASAKFNNGKRVDTIVQNLGYLVRSGYPDATDSMVPIAYSNIAMELILNEQTGRMASIRNGIYTSVDINEVSAGVKQVDVQNCYNTELLVPQVKTYTSMSMLMMTATEFLAKK
jgi:6-phosphofructokinase 1